MYSHQYWRNDRASSALLKCQQESSRILRSLQNEGFTQLEIPAFPYYDDTINTSPEPGHYLPFARSLALHLKLLWTIIQQRLVSIAVTYNPLMTAIGYTYQGHDHGWTLPPYHTLPPYWNKIASSPTSVAQDQDKATEIISKYTRLLAYGQDLSNVNTDFRQNMSVHLGPTLDWLPGFEISPLSKYVPPTVHIPEMACTHCSPERKSISKIPETSTDTHHHMVSPLAPSPVPCSTTTTQDQPLHPISRSKMFPGVLCHG